MGPLLSENHDVLAYERSCGPPVRPPLSVNHDLPAHELPHSPHETLAVSKSRCFDTKVACTGNYPARSASNHDFLTGRRRSGPVTRRCGRAGRSMQGGDRKGGDAAGRWRAAGRRRAADGVGCRQSDRPPSTTKKPAMGPCRAAPLQRCLQRGLRRNHARKLQPKTEANPYCFLRGRFLRVTAAARSAAARFCSRR